MRGNMLEDKSCLPHTNIKKWTLLNNLRLFKQMPHLDDDSC